MKLPRSRFYTKFVGENQHLLLVLEILVINSMVFLVKGQQIIHSYRFLIGAMIRHWYHYLLLILNMYGVSTIIIFASPPYPNEASGFAFPLPQGEREALVEKTLRSAHFGRIKMPCFGRNEICGNSFIFCVG